MNKTYIYKLMYELSENEGSFLYLIHENHFFNKSKFNEIIKNIKFLKSQGYKSFDNNFIYLILERLSYLGFIYSDLRINLYDFNIPSNIFFDYYEELLYEIKSLFNDEILEDYNGNKY